MKIRNIYLFWMGLFFIADANATDANEEKLGIRKSSTSLVTSAPNAEPAPKYNLKQIPLPNNIDGICCNTHGSLFFADEQDIMKWDKDTNEITVIAQLETPKYINAVALNKFSRKIIFLREYSIIESTDKNHTVPTIAGTPEYNLEQILPHINTDTICCDKDGNPIFADEQAIKKRNKNTNEITIIAKLKTPKGTIKIIPDKFSRKITFLREYFIESIDKNHIVSAIPGTPKYKPSQNGTPATNDPLACIDYGTDYFSAWVSKSPATNTNAEPAPKYNLEQIPLLDTADGICCDKDGHLIFARENAIKKWDKNTGNITTIAQLKTPEDIDAIALDKVSGKIIFSSGCFIKSIDENHIVSTIAGTRKHKPSQNSTLATDVSLRGIFDLYIHADTVYFSEWNTQSYNDYAVRTFKIDGEIHSIVEGGFSSQLRVCGIDNQGNFYYSIKNLNFDHIYRFDGADIHEKILEVPGNNIQQIVVTADSAVVAYDNHISLYPLNNGENQLDSFYNVIAGNGSPMVNSKNLGAQIRYLGNEELPATAINVLPQYLCAHNTDSIYFINNNEELFKLTRFR